jgi:hypothetical protein
MNASHGADDAFETNPGLCIAPAVMSRMKMFSDEMAKYGESYVFTCSDGDIAAVSVDDHDAKTFDIRKEDDPEDLVEILHPHGSLPCPLHGATKDWLLQVFKGNQGFELGTFNASILATVMKKQSSKWEDISMRFVSDALAGKLADELARRYQHAIACAGFLLKVERSDTPMTMNHYLNDSLQRR